MWADNPDRSNFPARKGVGKVFIHTKVLFLNTFFNNYYLTHPLRRRFVRIDAENRRIKRCVMRCEYVGLIGTALRLKR